MSKATKTAAVASKVNLTADVLEGVANAVQTALTMLYGAGVACGTDTDFGTVATDLERIKDVCKDGASKRRAEKSKPSICPRCQRLEVKANGLCVSCLSATQEMAKPAAAVKPAAEKQTKPAAQKTKPAETKPAAVKTDSKPTAQTVKPADAPAVESKPAAVKASKSKPVALPMPTTYREMVSGGAEHVHALAKQLKVETAGKPWAKLCSAVWAAAKGTPAAPTTNDKPATAKPASKCETYAAGTVLIADGKGGVRVATEADLWASLERMSTSGK